MKLNPLKLTPRKRRTTASRNRPPRPLLLLLRHPLHPLHLLRLLHLPLPRLHRCLRESLIRNLSKVRISHYARKLTPD